jgi:hypothetical protein
MTEEIKPQEETALSVLPSKELLAQLREGSGENSGNDLPFVPLIVVDNTMTTETTADGREVEALCPGRYKRTDKVEGEYVNTTIESFTGVVLVMKWQLSNKGKWDDASKAYVDNGAPMFATRLLPPDVMFGKRLFTVKYSDGTNEQFLYPEFKARFSVADGQNPDGTEKRKGLYNLEAIWFVKLLNGEIVRVKFRGASRAPLFEKTGYLASFKGSDSISAHKTLFTTKYEAKPRPHNLTVLELNDDEPTPIDWTQVISDQAEINALFNNAAVHVMEALGGTVVTEEEGIVVDEIPFK